MPRNIELPSLIERTIGHRSTKHVSYAESNCPARDDSLRVGQQMTVELKNLYHENSFFDFLKKHLSLLYGTDLVKEYERQVEGVNFPSHVDPEIDSNLKVNLQKNSEAVISIVGEKYHENSIPRIVLQLVEQHSKSQGVPIYRAVKDILTFLESNFHRLQIQLNTHLAKGVPILEATRKSFLSLLTEQNLSETPIDIASQTPVPLHISSEDRDGLVLISKLQELPYSIETLRFAEELLAKNERLREALLAYHLLLVDYAKKELAERGDEFSTLVPFEEIFIEHNGTYVPNIRLLKVMSNNWIPAIAQVMIDRGAMHPDQLKGSDFIIALQNVEKREKQFHLPIFMFNETANPDIVLLNGIIHKVCPAKSIITKTGIQALPLIYETIKE